MKCFCVCIAALVLFLQSCKRYNPKDYGEEEAKIDVDLNVRTHEYYKNDSKNVTENPTSGASARYNEKPITLGGEDVKVANIVIDMSEVHGVVNRNLDDKSENNDEKD